MIKKLHKIPDERGAIYHMLRNDDEGFSRFGEIYFSLVYPNIVKGWHLHKKMTLNYAVIHGMIKLVLFDSRKTSPTKGELMEIFIGEENYSLVTIPPLVWNGFKGIGTETAIVANCTDIPHHPEEIERLDPIHNDVIPYDWETVFK
jgi:dTDP-4-dehydrorhamnose 3,5-epimerase